MGRAPRNKKKTGKNQAQMELLFDHPLEFDRNFHLGGKSFYFFDFDDNVAHLTTPIVIFSKVDGHEKFLSSGEFAQHSKIIGKEGKYKDYFLNFADDVGSFRYFRDTESNIVDKFKRRQQTFCLDIEKILEKHDFHWKAPSWNCFHYATYNKRPLSLITARGHEPTTIKEGISLLVENGHLPHDPNYLSIYPVSNPNIRRELGDIGLTQSVAELKRGAIRASVEKAVIDYGHSPFHRFGMSDDDPHNVELITEEMRFLKGKYPEMSFFVIQTFEDSYRKNEVLLTSTREVISRSESQIAQLSMFEAL